MSITPRKTLEQINNYVAAKTLESAKRELGIERIIKLAGNENTNGYSPYVKEVLKNSLEELSYYPDMNCTKLREALADYHSIKTDELIFGNGSFELISILAQTFLEEGDESLIIEPSFGWYKNVTWQMGAKVVSVPLADFKVDLSLVSKSITKKTKIIWLCNPNNPTGTIVKEKELKEFIRYLSTDILLVLDEAYADFAAEDEFPDSLKYIKEYPNVIILRTFSKAYGLASFRLGYGIADKTLIASLNKVRIPINTNAIAQVAALASLHDRKFYNQVIENNKKGLALYYDRLNRLQLNYIKSNCNFILFDTKKNSEWLAAEFYKRGIIIRAGKEFGLPTWVRITIGTYEENVLVLNILEEVLNHNTKLDNIQFVKAN